MLQQTKPVKDVAKTIYNEARGEGEFGMRAVADTICNRMKKNKK